MSRASFHRGFTLIELLAVLCILALVVSAIGLSLRGPILRARINQTVARISDFESTCRVHTRTTQVPSFMSISSESHSLSGPGRGRRQIRLSFGRNCRLRFMTGRSENESQISIAPDGTTQDYVIVCESWGGPARYLCVGGFSGSVSVTASADTAHDFLKSP